MYSSCLSLVDKIDKNILGPNIFDPQLTRPKLFQTELTQSFASSELSGTIEEAEFLGLLSEVKREERRAAIY